MNVFLISEDEALARSIRQIMMRERVYCSLSAMISFDQASRRLSTEAADLIVAVLPEDPLRSVEALEILSTIPRNDRTLAIAVGPAADAKVVIRALRGIVDDYLDVADLENELVAVLSCWRMRWSSERVEGKVITVLSPVGGSGSSTIAANLAVELAKEHNSVGLLDLKVLTGDLAALLDLKPTHSLADLCKNLDRLDQAFFQKALSSHAMGVHLLSMPHRMADVNVVTSEGIRQTISLAQSTFPFVVIDLEHQFESQQVQVLRQSDLILLVVRLDFISLKHATRFLDQLDGLGIESNRIRLIANRAGQPREVRQAKFEEVLQTKFFHVIPEDCKAVNRANNNGIPLTVDAPRSSVSQSLIKLGQVIQTVWSLDARGGGKALAASPPNTRIDPAQTTSGSSRLPPPSNKPGGTLFQRTPERKVSGFGNRS